ncbi:GNAT family N-acetyltransferase [Risungbinella massiliensis]|uniref:GNAT family N-acetyltransferase n=1 Tax=Risungbinella massiliensis TaxID=1329796 RepID=UPI0005CC81B0|nr:GNAT family N-acetyltransferase [Risungbinella massiliensis]
MQIQLKEITRENWKECIKLQPAKEQQHFVASNLYSIAESKFYPSCYTMAIYAAEVMVGFTLYGYDQDTDTLGEYWISRLMIDEKYQRKGYAKAAMLQVLQQLRETPDCKKVKISYHPDNQIAAKLYQSLGFKEIGMAEWQEMVAELDLKA